MRGEKKKRHTEGLAVPPLHNLVEGACKWVSLPSVK